MRGFVTMDYDEAPYTYRGVNLSVGHDEDRVPLRFFTGDPVADYAACMKHAQREGIDCACSSSVDHFAGDVEGQWKIGWTGEHPIYGSVMCYLDENDKEIAPVPVEYVWPVHVRVADILGFTDFFLSDRYTPPTWCGHTPHGGLTSVPSLDNKLSARMEKWIAAQDTDLQAWYVEFLQLTTAPRYEANKATLSRGFVMLQATPGERAEAFLLAYELLHPEVVTNWEVKSGPHVCSTDCFSTVVSEATREVYQCEECGVVYDYEQTGATHHCNAARYPNRAAWEEARGRNATTA